MPNICIDFDTAICEEATLTPEGLVGQPNPDALDDLKNLCLSGVATIAILSKHSTSRAGPGVVIDWFKKFGYDESLVSMLMFPLMLPPYSIFISRKVWAYDQALPTPEELVTACNVVRVPVFGGDPQEPEMFPSTVTFGTTT